MTRLVIRHCLSSTDHHAAHAARRGQPGPMLASMRTKSKVRSISWLWQARSCR